MPMGCRWPFRPPPRKLVPQCRNPSVPSVFVCFFFFNVTATTEIYTSLHTLSLHDALPITATAHKLARLVYSMLRYGTAYVDAGQQAYEQKYRDRVLTNLQRKARVLGYQLVHVTDPGSAQAAATL